MVLAPSASIIVAYLAVISIVAARRRGKDELMRSVLWVIALVVLLLTFYTFTSYYQATKAEAASFAPTSYTQQWQKAMQWVREETPNNAVFSHWWDYGYWIQSMANRATVLDGGNALGYWNYLMGRLVLAGDNQKDALNFLYSHNATHLLIDSSDIGKYTAFSSIGSDLYYDRFDMVPTMMSDEKQIQETRDAQKTLKH